MLKDNFIKQFAKFLTAKTWN